MDIREKIKLHFDDDFYKEETRCDYKISAKTKRIWAVELDLLNELIRVCQKHDIKMCVSCGTLLGAIRHKGMIPWDDDLDVSLIRSEYEKLCAVAPKEFKHPYFFQNVYTDPQYLFGYSRLRNSLTTGLILDNNSINYNNGIYIDVFVMDGYVDDLSLLKKQQRRMDCLRALGNIYKNNFNPKYPVKAAVKKMLAPILKYTLFKFLTFDKIVDMYIKNQQRYNHFTDRVGIIDGPLYGVRKNWCMKEDLEKIIYVPFENIEVPVPANYDDMLRHAYGNYMEFPPVEKRGVWHEGVIEFDPDIPYKEYIRQSNSDNHHYVGSKAKTAIVK